jgi:hypothetical protein
MHTASGIPRQQAGDVDQRRVVGRQHQPARAATLEAVIAHVHQPGKRTPPVEERQVPVDQPLEKTLRPLPSPAASRPAG